MAGPTKCRWIDRIWAEFDQIWPDLKQVCPESGLISSKFGPNSAHVVQHWPGMGLGAVHWPMRPDLSEALPVAPFVQARHPATMILVWMDCIYAVGASQRRRYVAGEPLEDGVSALQARLRALERRHPAAAQAFAARGELGAATEGTRPPLGDVGFGVARGPRLVEARLPRARAPNGCVELPLSERYRDQMVACGVCGAPSRSRTKKAIMHRPGSTKLSPESGPNAAKVGPRLGRTCAHPASPRRRRGTARRSIPPGVGPDRPRRSAAGSPALMAQSGRRAGRRGGCWAAEERLRRR